MMIRMNLNSLMIVFALVLGACLLVATSQSVRAQTQESVFCYAVADGDEANLSRDQLVALNLVTAETTLIGAPGTTAIEAIAMDPETNTLYAAEAGQLGTLNVNTAAFTAKLEAFGTASGTFQEVVLDDVDGLTVDAATGTLYGVQRLRSPQPDILFQIDKDTGAHIPDAFGPGVDYVAIEGTGILNDIDDIAVDPDTGQMYAASNTGGSDGLLITVDKATGDATVVGPFSVDDIEGLAFSIEGQLYGSTGKFSTGPATEDQLYRIDATSGTAEFVGAFSQYTDHEALACLTEGEPTSVALTALTARDTLGRNGALAVLGLALLGALTLGAFVVRGSRQKGGVRLR